MDLKESSVLGAGLAQHWYYRAKAAALCRYLGAERVSRVLDVGAGSGFFTKYLLRCADVDSGVCVDTGYPYESTEEYFGKPIEFRRTCDSVDADLVLLMDVLEHVEDDRDLIVEYAAKVSSGTRFLFTVPAFQWMWSDHDVFLEHYRRYDIHELEQVVQNAGLLIERSSYYFALVFPIAYGFRLVKSLLPKRGKTLHSDLKKHRWLTNEVLSLVCQGERWFFFENRIFGLSVFCLARKA